MSQHLNLNCASLILSAVGARDRKASWRARWGLNKRRRLFELCTGTGEGWSRLQMSYYLPVHSAVTKTMLGHEEEEEAGEPHPSEAPGSTHRT